MYSHDEFDNYNAIEEIHAEWCGYGFSAIDDEENDYYEDEDGSEDDEDGITEWNWQRADDNDDEDDENEIWSDED